MRRPPPQRHGDTRPPGCRRGRICLLYTSEHSAGSGGSFSHSTAAARPRTSPPARRGSTAAARTSSQARMAASTSPCLLYTSVPASGRKDPVQRPAVRPAAGPRAPALHRERAHLALAAAAARGGHGTAKGQGEKPCPGGSAAERRHHPAGGDLLLLGPHRPSHPQTGLHRRPCHRGHPDETGPCGRALPAGEHDPLAGAQQPPHGHRAAPPRRRAVPRLSLIHISPGPWCG